MYINIPLNREYKELFTGVRTRTFWGKKMLAGLVDLDANAILPSHSHPHEQISYLVEGEIQLTTAGETKTVHKGEIIIIPGGIEHQVIVGPAPAIILDVFQPVREDLKY